MVIVAEFDKPYDALLLLLKDELQANSIKYDIIGENGNDVQYIAITFDIKVMVDENDFDSALAIFNELREKNRQSDS